MNYGVNGGTFVAAGAVLGIAWVLHRVMHKPSPQFFREPRAVNKGLVGTQRLQDMYPNGVRIQYRPSAYEWNTRGLDIYGGHYGIM